MTAYAVYHDADSLTILPLNATPIGLDADAQMLDIFYAETWEEAMDHCHVMMGWEPYRPWEE